MIVFAPEVHSFFLRPFLDYIRDRLGEKQLKSLLGEFGISENDLTDRTAWISLEFYELFFTRFLTLFKDVKALEECARLSLSTKYIGFLRALFRVLENPMFAYSQVAGGTSKFNKVGSYKIEKIGKSQIRLIYTSIESRKEKTEYICKARQAQLSAITTMFDLNPAQVNHPECMQRGDHACVYDIQWKSRPESKKKWIGLLISTGVVIALSFIIKDQISTTVLFFMIVTATSGWFVGRHLELKQEISARAKDLIEQQDALAFVTKANDERFEELLEAKNATERTVEERTRELRIASEQLKSLDELKSQFIANISHELRTPLTLSLGPLETLLEQEHTPQKHEYLDTVYRNQLRLTKLISDLLDFTKLEAGKVELQFTREDVKHVVQELASTLKAATEHRRIRFDVELPAHPVWLYIDRDKFEKIVMNLLSNAFKFTPDGGFIKVSLHVHENNVIFKVQDNGPGIPHDKLMTIFDRFSQVDASQKRHYGGTGLGLAMVREYTEMHGGSVQVESQLGEGSTFSVTFIRGKEHLDPERVSEDACSISGVHRYQLVEFETSVPSPVQSPTPATSEPIFGIQSGEQLKSLFDSFRQNTRILIVDDSPDMRAYLHSLLRDHYPHIDLAADGMEAMILAKERHPDLILSDVMMPKMSGDELCKAIKSEPPPLGRTPVILLTARAEVSAKLEGLGVGANDYLTKPFNARELKLRVRNILSEHYHERALALLHKRLESANLELNERKRVLDGDLEMARKFQQTLLPSADLLPERLQTQAIFRPLEKVGGDLYDISLLAPDKARFFLIDVNDHGIHAAMRTGIILSLYNTLKLITSEPGELLTILNQRIMAKHGTNISFSACCFDVYIPSSGSAKVRYSQSWELPLYISSNATIHKQPFNPDMMLGNIETLTYKTLEATLAPGERIFCFTDGLEEQVNSENLSFGDSKQLDYALQQTCSRSSIDEAINALITTFDNFRGSIPQDDDVTILGMELYPPTHAD